MSPYYFPRMHRYSEVRMQNVIHPTCPALPAANVTLATEQATASFGGYLVRQLSNVGSVFQNLSFSTVVSNTCRTGYDAAVRAAGYGQSLLFGGGLPAISIHTCITALGTGLPVFIPVARLVFDTMKTRLALGLKHQQQQNAQLQGKILATDVEATEERRELVSQRTLELESHAEKFKELSECSLFTAKNARSFALRNFAPFAILPQIGLPIASAIVVGSAVAHVVGHKVSGWYNRQAVEQINHLIADAKKNLAVENMYQTKVTKLQTKVTELQNKITELQERLESNETKLQEQEFASERQILRLRSNIRYLDEGNIEQQEQLSLYKEEIQLLKSLLAEKERGAVGGKEEEFFDTYYNLR